VRILITGGFGFIGSHFTELALKRGHEVTVIDSFTYASDLDNIDSEVRQCIKTLQIDISNYENLLIGIKNLKSFDAIANFAAETHVDRSIRDSEIFLRSNVLGVINLLNLTRDGLAGKYLQVSTDEVYGSVVNGKWDELNLLQPRSPYSASKASAEHFCMAFRETFGLNVLITRCANNYGAKQSVDKLIPKTIYSVLKGQQVPIYGNGLQIREWIYVSEHVKILLEILEADMPRHFIYNIGGKEKVNLDLVREIISLMGGNDSLINFVSDRPGHDFRYALNDSRLKSEFVSSKSPDFDSTLLETINWYSSNKKWVNRSYSKVRN
jgi:dTDP-glucose 4,6-dehydratase